MATGSRRWFRYVSDNGTGFGVELDESTYETALLGFAGVQPGDLAISVEGPLPIRPRYINVVRVNANDETIRAKFYVGSQAALAAIIAAGSVTVGAVAWGLSSVRGEERKLIPLTDTEQLDGDVDNNFAV